MRLRIAGTAPGEGEPHFASPSDCFGRPCRAGASDVHDPAEYEDRERTCAEMVAEWKRLGPEWPNGNKSGVARWVLGCVMRMATGGVGGRRILGATPEQALRPAWANVVWDHRCVRGLLLEYVHARGDARDRLGKRDESLVTDLGLPPSRFPRVVKWRSTRRAEPAKWWYCLECPYSKRRNNMSGRLRAERVLPGLVDLSRCRAPVL